ncbi:MAG: hypothetical protein WC947_08035 [Elusimicrobiota bacterium]
MSIKKIEEKLSLLINNYMKMNPQEKKSFSTSGKISDCISEISKNEIEQVLYSYEEKSHIKKYYVAKLKAKGVNGREKKEADILFYHKYNGPAIIIQTTSILTAFRNFRWDSIFHDAENFHAAYPKLVVGYIIVCPDKSLENNEKFPLEKVQRKLLRVTNREDMYDHLHKYERISLIYFKKTKNGIKILENKTNKDLRPSNFIQSICEIFKERFIE